MKIKGTAVKSISLFVKSKFKDRYNEWLKSLPLESQEIFNDSILATSWYPIEVAAVIPTKKLGLLFYNSVKEGAWQSGRFSAELALKGVYKVFVRATSPAFILKRASRIFSTYFRPIEASIVEEAKNKILLHVTKFPSPYKPIEYRIAGWVECALEINGAKNVSIIISQSLTKGDDKTEFIISWD